MKKLNYYNNGFTLLELSITMVIIAIFSIVVFTNYHDIEKKYALKRSAFQLATGIRQVEKMTLGANKFNNKFPEGGYGIYINPATNPTSSIIFADIKQESDITPNKKYDLNEKVENEKIELEPDVKFSAIFPNNVTHIIFLAPIPKIIFTDINGEIIDIDEINIKLSEKDFTKTQTIKINKIGKIEIK